MVGWAALGLSRKARHVLVSLSCSQTPSLHSPPCIARDGCWQDRRHATVINQPHSLTQTGLHSRLFSVHSTQNRSPTPVPHLLLRHWELRVQGPPRGSLSPHTNSWQAWPVGQSLRRGQRKEGRGGNARVSQSRQPGSEATKQVARYAARHPDMQKGGQATRRVARQAGRQARPAGWRAGPPVCVAEGYGIDFAVVFHHEPERRAACSHHKVQAKPGAQSVDSQEVGQLRVLEKRGGVDAGCCRRQANGRPAPKPTKAAGGVGESRAKRKGASRGADQAGRLAGRQREGGAGQGRAGQAEMHARPAAKPTKPRRALTWPAPRTGPAWPCLFFRLRMQQV